MVKIFNSKLFSLDFDMDNKQHLDDLVSYAKKLSKMETDKEFQAFIREKCYKTLEQVMLDNLVGGTTNDDAINIYITSNHIEETDYGFIMYNDAKIPADSVNSDAYPNGEFSIALAFEYGVGIVGENTANQNAWEYNVNNYNFGWYFKDDNGQWIPTAGYEGFQIYTLTANAIEDLLPMWVDEYLMKEV